jgi:hypothetical protein
VVKVGIFDIFKPKVTLDVVEKIMNLAVEKEKIKRKSSGSDDFFEQMRRYKEIEREWKEEQEREQQEWIEKLAVNDDESEDSYLKKKAIDLILSGQKQQQQAPIPPNQTTLTEPVNYSDDELKQILEVTPKRQLNILKRMPEKVIVSHIKVALPNCDEDSLNRALEMLK